MMHSRSKFLFSGPAWNFVAGLLALSSATAVLAADDWSRPSCYRLPSESFDTPENLDFAIWRQRVPPGSDEIKIWCYEHAPLRNGSQTFVYNVKDGKVRPEMAMLVESNPDGTVRAITSGSLVKGELSFHKVTGAVINPLPAPIDEKAVESARLVREFELGDPHRAAKPVLAAFEQHSFARTQFLGLVPGFSESFLDDHLLPFRGYWWPHAGVPLAAGDFSPLGKYDLAVKARTGVDPKSRDWEAINHSLEHVAWGGHCNGWAASAILYPEPSGTHWDQAAKIAFRATDIEGVMAEASFCVDWAFYGTRYNGPANDKNDITPDKFHKVLLYYIDALKKPIAFDYHPDESVDNNIITGYSMNIVPQPLIPNKFHVDVTLRAHKYDPTRAELDGHAEAYNRSYSYDLFVDAAGAIASGEWSSEDHPDFLWVPLAQSNCGRENPNIDPLMLAQIQQELVPIEAKETTISFDRLAAPLAPGAEMELLDAPLVGADFILKVANLSITTDPGLQLHVSGMQKYPEKDYEQTTETHMLSELVSQPMVLSFDRVTSVKIINTGTEFGSFAGQMNLEFGAGN